MSSPKKPSKQSRISRPLAYILVFTPIGVAFFLFGYFYKQRGWPGAFRELLMYTLAIALTCFMNYCKRHYHDDD